MTQAETKLDQSQVYESFKELAARVSRLEAHLGLPPIQAGDYTTNSTSHEAVRVAPRRLKDEGAGLELKIGQFGLAWVGSGVLFLGVAFLMSYAQGAGKPALASAAGYVAAVALYSSAQLWRQTIPYLSRVLVGSSLLLLYYTTVHLGFFSTAPLIPNKYIAVSLLLIVVGLQLTIAIRRNWQALAGIAIMLWLASAMLIDIAHVTLPLVAAGSAIATCLAIRRNWRQLFPLLIILAYGTHLLWLLGNPIVSLRLRAADAHEYNLVYLFVYASIFYLPALRGEASSGDEARPIVEASLNSLGLSMLVALAALTHFAESYAGIYLCAAAFLLCLSITQWLKTNQQHTPAIYASFGYMALSIAIYGYTRIPTAFMWLSLQSLLVVSMALWFRSRTLVVMNSIIFLIVLVAYFAASPSSDQVNFSFVLVAVASARVMNWQKERLTLRTESLRNIYLAIAFTLILYALYRAVPAQYVTLSWSAMVIVYFLISYLLHNTKYR
jgi:hypothetical protein